MISKKSFEFLQELKTNNNKEWFAQNKLRYEEALSDFKNLVQKLITELSRIDSRIIGVEAKDCIFRIYRDVRFSKDKTPYKPNFGAYISNGGRKSTFGGYYIHFEHENSFLAGGVYMPEKNVLKAVRDEIYYNVDNFKSIVLDSKFVKYFGELMGEKLVKIPQGYPKDFPEAEFLKYKNYAFLHQVENDFFFTENALQKTLDIFKILKPFNDFVNQAIEENK